jgi:glycine betaine/proline transport system substrate-binding protein
MKSLALFAGCMLAAAAFGGAAEAKTKVAIGQEDWTGATAIENVLAVVMPRYLDADVSTIQASVDAMLEAMHKGDGSVDLIADLWTDHLPAQMKAYILPGSAETILLNDTPYLGNEGIFVPAYVAEEHGVKALADLAKPEVAKLFDTDGNGKGEMWAGASGWESTSHTEVRAKSYGFDKTMDLTVLDQAVFLAQLKDAYENKKPIVFYYWTPEWIFAKYDLVKLEEPPFTGYTTDEAKGTEKYNPEGCYTFYQPAERNDWLEASSITCDQPPTKVHVAYSKALAERAPDVAQFLKQVKLDVNTVNRWIYAMQVDNKPAEEMAKEWVDQNKALIEGEWLKGIAGH